MSFNPRYERGHSGGGHDRSRSRDDRIRSPGPSYDHDRWRGGSPGRGKRGYSPRRGGSGERNPRYRSPERSRSYRSPSPRSRRPMSRSPDYNPRRSPEYRVRSRSPPPSLPLPARHSGSPFRRASPPPPPSSMQLPAPSGSSRRSRSPMMRRSRSPHMAPGVGRRSRSPPRRSRSPGGRRSPLPAPSRRSPLPPPPSMHQRPLSPLPPQSGGPPLDGGGGGPPRPSRWDQQTNRGAPSKMPNLLTPFDDCEGKVLEYISADSGTLEIKVPDGVSTRKMSCFFHADSVWIVNKWGNPYGPPVPFADPNGAPRGGLGDELPVGSEVNVRAVNSAKNQQLFEALALRIWPRSAENPAHESTQGYIALENSLVPHFDRFADLVVPNELVEASIHWPRPESACVATVCEIKNDMFGIIEADFRGKRFYCFFHRNNVWLRDGKRGVEVDFFKDKPLSAMVSKGQKVNVSARSVCNTKGRDMTPVALEFQAISVSLDPNAPPQAAPAPTRCGFGPGVYGSDLPRRFSLFYLEPDLFNRTNQEFVDFVDQTGLHLLPGVDEACKVIKNQDIKPVIAAAAAAEAERGGGASPPPSSPPASAAPAAPLVILDLKGKVVKVFNDTFGLVQLADGVTLCLATITAAMLVKSEPFFKAFPVGVTVSLNAQLIDQNRPVSHATTLIWNPKLFNKDRIQGRDVPLDKMPEFKIAYEKCNAEFNTYSHEFSATTAAGANTAAAAPPSSAAISSGMTPAAAAAVPPPAAVSAAALPPTAAAVLPPPPPMAAGAPAIPPPMGIPPPGMLPPGVPPPFPRPKNFSSAPMMYPPQAPPPGSMNMMNVMPPAPPAAGAPAGMPPFVASALGITEPVAPNIPPPPTQVAHPPAMPVAAPPPRMPVAVPVAPAVVPSAVPEPEPVPKSKAYYENAPGKVCKVLDQNFALIKPTYNATNLVLFDTCDIWLTKEKTADKFDKKLGDVVTLGQDVRFNGAYLEESAIPYLATSVWHESCHQLTNQPPGSINKEKIHPDKIKIYRQVVQSVAPTLKMEEAANKLAASKKMASEVLYGKYGTVRSLFLASPIGQVVAGIIEFGGTKSNYGVFHGHNRHPSNMPLKIGMQVKVNATVAEPKQAWSTYVPYVVLSVYHTEIMDENQVELKVKQTVDKMNQLLTENPTCIDPTNLKFPRVAVVEFSSKVAISPPVNTAAVGRAAAAAAAVVAANSAAVTRAAAAASAPPSSTAVSSGGSTVVGGKLMPNYVDVPSATLKCMLSDKEGILSDDANPERLCYFETTDLNVNLATLTNVKDTVLLLNRMKGTKVRLQARAVNPKGTVQYVSHDKGVQVVGFLPPFMSHVQVRHAEKSRNAAVLSGSKVGRFWKAQANYSSGNYRSIATILEGGGGSGDPNAESNANKKKEPMTSLTRSVGKVKHVINDNFGLVLAADGRLALFDTYDYHLPDVNQTAAEAGKSLKDVVSAGTSVKVNAHEVDRKSGIPYLCTSVWSADSTANPGPEPLAKSNIQPEKIHIHEQVAKSCADLIKKLNAEAPVEKANSALEARREQIERVYASRAYREYLRRIPKHKRISRDPRTPDRNDKTSAADWSVKLKHWQREIEAKYGEGGDKRSRSPTSGRSGSVGRVTADLYEHVTSGIYHRQVSSKAAIFKLNSGKKVLVDRDRIWSGNGPYKGSWSELHHSVNIRARSVSSRYPFEYQALFAHFGYHQRDKNSRKFIYSAHAMKRWITDNESDEKGLNAELDAARNRLRDL